jgi:hypothetical protein
MAIKDYVSMSKQNSLNLTLVTNFTDYLTMLYQVLTLFGIEWDERLTMFGQPERKEMGLL